MRTRLVALVLLCLMTGTAIAQSAKVTSFMSKDLPENPGREALMITVEYPPGSSDPIHRHNAHALVYSTGGLRCDAGEGWKTGNTDTRTDLL
jgi:quercetin dioxygenase-like cupin family protein